MNADGLARTPALHSPYMIAVPEKGGAGHGRYEIQNKKSRDPLGGIFWYSRWRQYVFIPADITVILSDDCLEALAQFVSDLNGTR